MYVLPPPFSLVPLTHILAVLAFTTICASGFNRIDLPLYDSKKKLKKFLTMAIQMEATGFDID